MSTIQFYGLIESIYGPLFSFAYGLTKNKEEAKDLIQETILKALKYRNKYEAGTNFKAWIYTIMKNSFINNYKKAKRFSSTFEDKELLTVKNTATEGRPESVSALDDINKAINNLDYIYKKPFLMHTEGYKYQEIAEELNIPEGTVKSRIFLARQKLSIVLKDYKN
jgi:RNA polymerase sigma factor (sigma-70 family)